MSDPVGKFDKQRLAATAAEKEALSRLTGGPIGDNADVQEDPHESSEPPPSPSSLTGRLKLVVYATLLFLGLANTYIDMPLSFLPALSPMTIFLVKAGLFALLFFIVLTYF